MIWLFKDINLIVKVKKLDKCISHKLTQYQRNWRFEVCRGLFKEINMDHWFDMLSKQWKIALINRKYLIILHNNARHHDAQIYDLGCEILDHSHYLSDLVITDYNLFNYLSNLLQSKNVFKDFFIKNAFVNFWNFRYPHFFLNGVT